MSRKTGLWLIGACGGVSTTVAVGLSALKQQLSDQCGLVSEMPEFKSLDFVNFGDIVLGGHEIRNTTCTQEAELLCNGPQPVFAPSYFSACKQGLEDFDSQIRPGIVNNVGDSIKRLGAPDRIAAAATPREAIQKIQADLEDFKQQNDCQNVIVINVASTEPDSGFRDYPEDWDSFAGVLDDASSNLPASSLYSIAALSAQMPFVNFTPSLANNLSAINDLAIQKNVCHAGCDGKTGETFLKSVLAPAFARRNLDIMSWVGHNIFGNMDGQILDDPVNKETKVSSKGKMLQHILGYQPQSHISIEYIKSLGDWKTAWDHIHFRGFLSTPMTLQFTWQGCDSILAAPLVLDLCRFAELSQQRGESGLLTHLGSFFKSPLGSDEHDFSIQFQQLLDWAAK